MTARRRGWARAPWCLLGLVLAIIGCDDGADGAADAMMGDLDAARADDGVPSDATPADDDGVTLDATLDGAMPDATPDATPDQGPVDLCEAVSCEADALCDPRSGACEVVGEPAPGEPGGACASDDDCDAGECVTDTPGGFCRTMCDGDLRCGSVDQRCAVLGDVGGGAPVSVCLDECAVTGCREGWVCVPDADGAVCLPHCRAGGCNARSYCDDATGACVPFDGPDIGDGEPCNARDDRCGPALACLPEDDSGNGVCRALCEDDVAPCPEDAFCARLFDGGPDEPVIGICLPGDGCSPLDPAAVCGPDAACVAAPPVTLCVGIGPQALGETCDGAALCEAGLLCQYGRCTRPCADREACDAGERCVDYSARVGRRFGFCHADCDALQNRGCMRRQACRLVDMVDGAPVGRCVTEDDIGGGQAGEPCAADGTLSGDCAPDHVCDPQAPVQPTCRPLCTAATAAECPDGICAGGVFEAPFDALGMCLGGCAVVSPRSDCGGVVPQTCQFTGLVGVDRAGQERLVGECLPTQDNAQVATGQRCRIDAEIGIQNCANGNICARVAAGEALECVQLCVAPAPGERNPCRQPDRRCVTGLFAGSARYGACLPE